MRLSFLSPMLALCSMNYWRRVLKYDYDDRSLVVRSKNSKAVSNQRPEKMQVE